MVLIHPAGQASPARVSTTPRASAKASVSIRAHRRAKKSDAQTAGKSASSVKVVPDSGYGQYGQQSGTGAPQTGSQADHLQSAQGYDGRSKINQPVTDTTNKAKGAVDSVTNNNKNL